MILYYILDIVCSDRRRETHNAMGKMVSTHKIYVNQILLSTIGMPCNNSWISARIKI